MKKLKAPFYFISLLLIWITSCELQDEKVSSSSSLKLRFSTDTVLFDTLLTERLSITKRFRIYNPNKNAVSISSIRLGLGSKSDYSIIVNGKTGDEIQDEVLFGKDSLMVLVDVDIDQHDEDMPYLVKDSVIVEWNGNSGHVKLVAWGQDAHYYNAEEICDQVWTAERPYVIYNYLIVDSLCTLTMEPGTRVYLDNSAGLYVQGTLKVQGDSGNHVLFRNTRFDEGYERAPGQWDGIYFLEGSKNNEITFADIENGTRGVYVGSPDDDIEYDVEISHSSIRHMSRACIEAYTSDLKVVNTEMYYGGGFVVGNFLGGNYWYEHCTISNYPNDFQPENPALQITDYIINPETEELIGPADLSFMMRNSIVWGPNDEELFIDFTEQSNISIEIRNNIIRSEQDGGLQNYTSVEDNFPGFIDPGNYNYDLDSLAFARDKGVDYGYTFDIKGEDRDSKPDIGAHERIDP